MSVLRQASSACFVAALSLVCAAAIAQTPKAYAVHNLVSNGVVESDHVDPNMVDTWGVSFNPAGLVWVTNNRSGTSTLYDGLGVPNALVVNVPKASGSGVGSPTGIVFSGTGDYVVGNGATSGPSRFIFASEDGLISGWAPNVDLHNAIGAAHTPGAVYLGLAVADSSTGSRLYATDYRNGRVDMFDSAFAKLSMAGAFVDPKLPKGMVPFGIQALSNQLYVTYIRAGDYKTDISSLRTGEGVDSVVSVFDSEGRFLRRAVTGDVLRQPWGLAVAPANFGVYSNRLLVADFHEGTINAYDRNTGKRVGTLKDADGHQLKVPGIWGMQFGNGINSQPLNTLFFAAGPNGEGGGVYGSITAVPAR